MWQRQQRGGLEEVSSDGGKQAEASEKSLALLGKRTGPRSCPENYADGGKMTGTEIIRSAHMRKLQLAADRFFPGLAAICGPALLSGQTGNGLSCGGLRSWLV